MRIIWPAACAALFLAGCSPGKDVPAADAAINAFHSSLNRAEFAAIYAGSAPEMKNAATVDKLTAILSAVHRKLGLFKNGTRAGWNDNVTTGGHFVTVSYAANYERGKANESFVIAIRDGKPVLAGYNVNSDALILN